MNEPREVKSKTEGYSPRGVALKIIAYQNGISKNSNAPVADLIAKVGKSKFKEICKENGL